MQTALLAAALLIGCLLAVQASVNQQLNKAVGTPFGASALQLALATGLLLVLSLFAGAGTDLAGVADAQWWHLLGGLASPFYITSGILLIPRLGAVTTVGLFVSGQMFASVALDLSGALGVEQRPLSPGMAAGGLAVLIGIVVIVRAQSRAAASVPVPAAPGGGGAAVALEDHQGFSPGRLGWPLLGLAAGGVLPAQGAVNAQLREVLGDPLAVASVSFIVATLAITAALVVLLATHRTPRPRMEPLGRMPWWGWLGAACAVGYVTGTFLLIPVVGAAVTIALTVSGQQLTSAAIDQFGLFRLPRRSLTSARVIGLVLLVAGAFAIQLL
ncbi:transporter family-2 protein [Lipingzhangella halophila]|uniref:Transporter family-2 protein n=1 Tax=Lipingzhangella halophila TaxID=1783352 RepID=A0A7W7RKY2_9ACTN|nr:DMT family transporter [Lipingzhangella halophila]MBB4933889.1 transporter family-2 protein [Lipingzhangella halophila]